MNRVLAGVAAFLAFGSPTVGPSGYRETNKVTLPGPAGWDYVTVDPASRRVYVSHATQVEVLDADTLKVVGSIPGTPGVHGIAIAPEIGKGFITAGKADAVVMFDLATLEKPGTRQHRQKAGCDRLRPCDKACFRHEWLERQRHRDQRGRWHRERRDRSGWRTRIHGRGRQRAICG